MAFLPRPVSPRRAFQDLRAFLAQRRRHEIVFAALALFFPSMIILGFYIDSQPVIPYEEPEITYVTSWPASRTVAEARRQQAIDLPKERAEKARVEKILAERRRPFQEMDKKMDDLGL